MATMKAGQALAQVLENWGVDHVYGIPASSINNVLEGLWQERDQIRYVQVRHEEAGALAAAADAKYTGTIGVAFASAGPGSVHMLNGLYDAKMDHVPVLALVGQVATPMINTNFFQEMDEVPIFADVAVYNRQVANAQQIPMVIDEAIRAAYTKRGVAVVILPDDLSGTPIEYTRPKAVPVPAAQPDFPIDQQDVDAVVEALSHAKRPVMWIGRGLRGGRDSVMRFSEKFHIPVLTAAPATGIVPQTWPNYMGRRGRLGDKSGFEASQLADLLIFAGTNYPFARFLPKDKTIIQINNNPADIDKQYDADIAIVADAKRFLDELSKRDATDIAKPFELAARKNRANWLAWLDARADSTEGGLAPEAVIRGIARHASSTAVFGVDVGNNTAWSLRQLPFDGDQRMAMSPWYGTMGFAVPAGMAASLSFPDREVWTVSGDGGFAMLGEEILTEVRYDMPVVNVVLQNGTFGFIRHEQIQSKLATYGTDLQKTDWAGVAENMGAIGLRADSPESLDAAFNRIAQLRKDGDRRPVVLDATIRSDDPIDTSFMPLDEQAFGADAAKAYRERYHLDDQPSLRALLDGTQAAYYGTHNPLPTLRPHGRTSRHGGIA